MKTSLVLCLLCAALAPAQEYTLGPDSQPQSGVPQGKLTKYTWSTSKIYPGSVRDSWVYVPAQYDGSKPACVMIFQDGGGLVSEKSTWHAPVVMDNLIHKREMPVTIGIFINPGVMPALGEGQTGRYNRSFEYDALGDRYARFLLEEILPEVGKQYKLSSSANDRGLAGSSSGAIAAFTAAWNRPDAFSRVLSFIGSYTNLRGGQIYSSLVRKVEPKPLRVFVQDGKADQNIYAGNWWIANQDLASALDYAGYDTTFVVGTEGHNGRHGSAILPEALRWLWREYPKPITTADRVSERHEVRLIADPNHTWELAAEGFKATDSAAIDAQGNVFFADVQANRIHKIGADGKVAVFKENTSGAKELMFGGDGRLYAVQPGRKRIVAFDAKGAEETVVEGVVAGDLVVTRNNGVYFTEPAANRVWFADAKRAKRVVHEGITAPSSIGLSADQFLLYVSDARGKWVWSFQVQPDGSIANGQPFFRMETPDDDLAQHARGLMADTDGYLYVATELGIQICDQAGRVTAILNAPTGARITNLGFGGSDLQTLYATAGDKVYKRTIRRKGVLPWAPVTPPTPRL